MALNLYSLFLLASFVLVLQLAIVHPSSAHPSRKLLTSTEKSSFPDSLDRAKRYLQKYGYMAVGSADPNIGPNADEETVGSSSVEAALRFYQERNRLNVTGKLDHETVSRMMTPRCGMPDIVRKKSKRAGKFHVVAHYALMERMDPWTKRELTYGFTSTIESVSLEDLRAICSRAFQRWAEVSAFQFQEAGEGEGADINIGFYSGDHGDGAPFDGPGHVLAHSFAPQDGRLHFDASEEWSTSTPTMSETDLESVTVHEIGHTLGLGHSEDANAIMYPYLSPGEVKRDLQEDDISGLQAIYPSK